jgi:PBP1b-binding outer membrane lipoprotein LpoB
MKLKQILMLIILILILTACVVAKMPGDGDSTQRAQPEPTLGLLYVEETVINPYPISVYEPYP